MTWNGSIDRALNKSMIESWIVHLNKTHTLSWAKLKYSKGLDNKPILDLIAIIGVLFMLVATTIVSLSSVVISVRRNELIWTFFILTLGGAWIYYLIDWFSDERGD